MIGRGRPALPTGPETRRRPPRVLSRRTLLAWAAILGGFRLGPGRLAAQAAEDLVTLGDSQGYTKGAYTAFMAPFNKGELRAGIDYQERIRLDPARFPAGTTISWTWPEARVDAQIRGWLAIDYGNYDNTIPAQPIRSRRVSEIRRLTCNFDLEIGGTLSGFDVVIDFFLTLTPDFTSFLFEIEIFLHAPDYVIAYTDKTRPIGRFRSRSGSTWIVSKDPAGTQAPIVLIHPEPGQDILVGSVDIGEMLSWLRDRGVLTGDEFFNGLGLGVEPQQQDGTFIVKAVSVDYA